MSHEDAFRVAVGRDGGRDELGLVRDRCIDMERVV